MFYLLFRSFQNGGVITADKGNEGYIYNFSKQLY